MKDYNLFIGDSRKLLSNIRRNTIQTCVTSPPYWGLRDYNDKNQIGLDQTVDEYIEDLVSVFNQVKRVLHEDGTLWLNIGDTYISNTNINGAPLGAKIKDLAGIPWRLAFALQNAGWYLRQDIIWSKPNTMPEPVTDRCTKSHEYLFLLSKSPNYFYNHEIIKEDPSPESEKRYQYSFGSTKNKDIYKTEHSRTRQVGMREFKDKRNKRDVWTISPKGYDGTHSAVMPEELVLPCILAGSLEGDIILDPFAGTGTTGAVALQNGRKFIGVELNPDYANIALDRLSRFVKAEPKDESHHKETNEEA